MAIDINKILDEARALGCSDLHFTVGIPPIVRQGGIGESFSSLSMTGWGSKFSKYARINCTDKQRQSYRDHIDTDFTYVSSRVSVTVACVSSERKHGHRSPSFEKRYPDPYRS